MRNIRYLFISPESVILTRLMGKAAFVAVADLDCCCGGKLGEQVFKLGNHFGDDDSPCTS